MSRIIFLAAILAAAPVLYAQVNKSNLTGIVRDASGAPAPQVAIRLTNLATGAARSEVSDATGFYRFTLVDRGTYRLEAEHPGFKRFRQDNVELQTGETTTIDIALEVGEIAESVTVSAESAVLRTETGALGTTVNTQVLNELPLIGRNPYVFLTLSPGIQYTGDPGALNPWDVSGPSAFTASGSKAKSEFLLDGIPNMGIGNVSFSPSPDATQEMRVQTNAYDAEFGHSGAGFVNVSTRSGTNNYHGTAYWYLRNDNLNANNFFNNRVGSPKANSSRTRTALPSADRFASRSSTTGATRRTTSSTSKAHRFAAPHSPVPSCPRRPSAAAIFRSHLIVPAGPS